MGIKEDILRAYVLEEDYDIISQVTRRKGICVTFRDAGEDTLRQLRRGAGAKPHSILDKTIKGDSAVVNTFLSGFDKELYANHFTASMTEQEKTDKVKKLHENMLLGFVGHWTKKNEAIDGIYVTEKGKNAFSESSYLKVAENGMYYLSLENKEGKEFLNSQFDEDHLYDYASKFFTGDYDTHDLVEYSGSCFPVPTKRDMEILSEIINPIRAKRRELLEQRGITLLNEKQEDYNRIQHGPQFNYIAQILNDNYGRVYEDITILNYIMEKVTDMASPVAMCDKGEWKIKSNQTELRDWYQTVGISLKNTWLDTEDGRKVRLEYLRMPIVQAIEIMLNKKSPLTENFIISSLSQVDSVSKFYRDELSEYVHGAVEDLLYKDRIVCIDDKITKKRH